MSGMLIFLYGLYFVGVGIQGNEKILYDDVTTETGFVPWMVSAVILAIMAQNKYTGKFVAPIAALAITGFAVTHANTIKTEFQSSYDLLTGRVTNTQGGTVANQFYSGLPFLTGN